MAATAEPNGTTQSDLLTPAADPSDAEITDVFGAEQTAPAERDEPVLEAPPDTPAASAESPEDSAEQDFGLLDEIEAQERLGATAGPASPEATIDGQRAQRGPAGLERDIGMNLMLGVATLGVWGFFWLYQVTEEMRQYRKEGISGATIVTLCVIFPLAPIAAFLLSAELERLYRSDGERPVIYRTWGAWFLLPIIGTAIWYVGIQQALNSFWAERQTPDSEDGGDSE